MISNIQFGQYYPAHSFMHKLDPRAKILLLIGFITAVFLVDYFLGFFLLGTLLLTTIKLSKVPFLTVLKSLKAILILIVLTFILNVFFYVPSEGSTTLFWIITLDGLLSATFISLRLIFLIMGSSILTLTTTPVSLTDGLESLLKPLKYIKFPVHELALIMSIALRFIPTLASETDRIINAQKARGGQFDSGNLISRAKALLPILIPLLVSAFRRADELGDAMDARCYTGSKGRTKFKKLKFSYRDLISFAMIALAITFVVLINTHHTFLIGLIGL